MSKISKLINASKKIQDYRNGENAPSLTKELIKSKARIFFFTHGWYITLIGVIVLAAVVALSYFINVSQVLSSSLNKGQGECITYTSAGELRDRIDGIEDEEVKEGASSGFGESRRSGGFCGGDWVFPFETPKIVTSLYGIRTAPCDGVCSTDHKGVDFGAPAGEPVLAASSGRVIEARMTDVCDFDILIEHDGGDYRTRYVHLQEKAEVEVGDLVDTGQVIGYIANPSSSSCSTGPHLHFEFHQKSKLVNLFGITIYVFETMNPVTDLWSQGLDLTQGGIVRSSDRNHLDRLKEVCTEAPALFMCSN
jgi:murein DD-endopeptidase MepM/ murein hydrolase activator NlpD